MRPHPSGEVVQLHAELADVVAQILVQVGVRHAFGVSGGGIARVWQALLDNPDIHTIHFRHESGAAFAAIEASLVCDGPVCVFCTTGPGMTNALTGLAAARSEGAKLVLISPRTSPGQRGRGAVQETPMPSCDFFTPGWLFDDVLDMESPEQIAQVAFRLRHGFERVGAYVAHLSIPVDLQSSFAARETPGKEDYRLSRPFPDRAAVHQVAELMCSKRFGIWVGHGARHASRQVRALVDLTGAPVLATPRGKGIVSEFHPQFTMVTGLGGHPEGMQFLERYAPEFMLVLGTRLGEPSSGWDRRLVPPYGFVHVDIDPSIPGSALRGHVVAIHADIGAFLDELLAVADGIPHRPFRATTPHPRTPSTSRESGAVRPKVLMSAIQRAVVDAGIPLLVEPGSAMAWAANLLMMRRPSQLRIVGSFGSMGQMTCGVVGSALARGGPAVCLTGDGSMLMNNEINTAVEYGVAAKWVVLNDGRYQMCERGMGFGPNDKHARFAQCDFVKIARGMGAWGISVRRESELQPALCRALFDARPFLVDVVVDAQEVPPFESRFATLR